MIFQEDMVQRKGKRLQRLLPDSRFQLAFPDDDGMPSHFCQPMQHLMVPLPVPPDLILPELGIRFRHHIILASFMSMPEASIHQNAGTILSEHNIRFSRQPWMIEPIPESPSPQELPDKNLRFGILASDCRHVMVALFYGHFIWHALYLLFARGVLVYGLLQEYCLFLEADKMHFYEILHPSVQKQRKTMP